MPPVSGTFQGHPSGPILFCFKHIRMPGNDEIGDFQNESAAFLERFFVVRVWIIFRVSFLPEHVAANSDFAFMRFNEEGYTVITMSWCLDYFDIF